MPADDAYDDLGPLYDAWVATVVEDIPFYREAVTRCAGADPEHCARVLELGAGAGRMTLRLLADGASVTAIDRSAGMLARLAERAAIAGTDAQLTTVQHDLSTGLPSVIETPYDVVIAPFRTMLHLVSQADLILASASSALRSGGMIAFDVAHHDDASEHELHGQWFDRGVAVLATPDGPATIAIGERPWYSHDTGIPHVMLDLRIEAPPGVTALETSMQFALPPRSLWVRALEQAGFIDIDVSGAVGPEGTEHDSYITAVRP